MNRDVKNSTRLLASKEDLEKVLSDIKTDMPKWFISLFIALAIMIIGLYFK